MPGLLFCAIAQSRSSLCLSSYTWDADLGYRPSLGRCDPTHDPELLSSAVFYGRAVLGLVTGNPGRSREDASTSMTVLLARRGARSLAIVALAIGGMLLASLALGRLDRFRARWLPDGRPRWLLWLPAAVPLPIAGFAVFAAVLRLVPPGHVLDYDRMGVLWAGLTLMLADGVGRVLLGGLRQVQQTEEARRYAETQDLWGLDGTAAAAEASARVRAAQVRAGLLALVGGLVVVEGIFSVNGMGETLKDLVVDRQGLDPLLLCAVLLAFGLSILVIHLAPFERLVLWWRP